MIKRFIIALVLLVLVVGGIVGFNMFRDKAISDFFANMPVQPLTVSTVEVEPMTWTPDIQAIGTVGAETSVEQAQAAAAASAAQGAKLEAVLEQKRLVAPFKGTLGIPRIDVGQFVQPGTTVATLQDLDTMRADFSVPEQRLTEIEIGQPVRFGLNENDLPFEGKIIGIDPKVDPNTRLVFVRAEIENPEGKLSPGQFVQVRVLLPREDGVIAVPQTAVVTSLYGDYVYAVRPAEEKERDAAAQPAASGGEAAPAEGEAPAAQQPAAQGEAPKLQARQIFVKIGRRSGGRIEITEGLKAGDQIITAGQNRISNGAPIVIDNTVQPTTAGEAEDQADAK